MVEGGELEGERWGRGVVERTRTRARVQLQFQRTWDLAVVHPPPHSWSPYHTCDLLTPSSTCTAALPSPGGCLPALGAVRRGAGVVQQGARGPVRRGLGGGWGGWGLGEGLRGRAGRAGGMGGRERKGGEEWAGVKGGEEWARAGGKSERERDGCSVGWTEPGHVGDPGGIAGLPCKCPVQPSHPLTRPPPTVYHFLN